MQDHPRQEVSRIQEFLKITFETMDQGITIYDDELRLVAWNDRYAGMGIHPKELLCEGTNLLDLYAVVASTGIFGPGDPDAIAWAHVEAIRSGPLIHTEVLTPPTGRSILIRRFRLPNGGICATFNDVTDELRAESELRQSQKMDAIGKLTGGVAHDINNVLAVVEGNLELALEKVSDPEGNRLIRSALDASERGSKLTHRLLAFARRQPLSPTLTDAGALLSGFVDMLRKMLGASIEVELIRDANLWLCHVDRNQFENVVLNLAINARDAMPEGGKLLLRVANVEIDDGYAASAEIDAGPYICVSATDSGYGMDAATLDRAFEPFFTTKAVGRGTGLGLSMAHGFVKQSGGHIAIESGMGSGTVVSIYLPRVNDELVEAAAEKLPQSSPRNCSGFVVVVEDDDDLRPILVSQLEALGFRTLPAVNGIEALEVLREAGQADLLLTDVILPGGLSGYELAEAARKLVPSLPVVFMSGYTESAAAIPSQFEPDAELLRKPFRRADLVQALTRAVEAR